MVPRLEHNHPGESEASQRQSAGRRIRRFSDVPVIIVTGQAKGTTDKVKGLERGADDYLDKPFSHNELVSRIFAVLRRTRTPELRTWKGLVGGSHLVIDRSGRRVTVDGELTRLTATEWILLSELVENEGRVVSQQRLAERLWGDSMVELTSTIRWHVSRLRGKLADDPQAPRIILTEKGRGYRFVRSE